MREALSVGHQVSDLGMSAASVKIARLKSAFLEEEEESEVDVCGMRRRRQDLRRGGCAAKPSMLDLNDPVHGIECTPQLDRSAVMFTFQLLDQLLELVLGGSDLVLYQARPFLQISTDITHRLSPHSVASCSLPLD